MNFNQWATFPKLCALGWYVTDHLTPPSVPHIVHTGMGHHWPCDSVFCSPLCPHWDGTALTMWLCLLFPTLSTLRWDSTDHVTPPSVPHIVHTGMGHHWPCDSAFCSPHCPHWDGTSLTMWLRLLFPTLSTLRWDSTDHVTPSSVPHIVNTEMGHHWPCDSAFCFPHCPHWDGMLLTMWLHLLFPTLSILRWDITAMWLRLLFPTLSTLRWNIADHLAPPTVQSGTDDRFVYKYIMQTQQHLPQKPWWWRRRQFVKHWTSTQHLHG
jgi:hypothetical protein